MPRRYYSSTAQRTTLSASASAAATTLTVNAVTGFPASLPYTLIVDQDTVSEEIVEVTARSGTTLTVTRGVDGTTATSHASGASVQHGVSARDFDEPNAFINGTGVVTSGLLADSSVTSAKIADGTIVNADISASAAIAQSKIASLTTDLANKRDNYPAQNTQTGTGASAYTFALADASRLTVANAASAATYTIPPQSSVTWVDNAIIQVTSIGAGVITFAGGSGVTVTNTAATLSQYQSAALIRTGSNAWTVLPFSGAGKATVSATTGSPTIDTSSRAGKTIYTFTQSGSITFNNAGSIELLAVGSGGGGGSSAVGGYNGGGGGGGEVAYSHSFGVHANSYTVTVGGTATAGTIGNSSSLVCSGTTGHSAYAIGGGAGGGYNSAGGAGGSGGGGGGTAATTSGGTGLAGTNGAGASSATGAAGGGAGTAASGNTAGTGISLSITGSAVTYGAGGIAGGSANGTANQGNGGGGSTSNGTGGTGGSGVVIVVVG